MCKSLWVTKLTSVSCRFLTPVLQYVMLSVRANWFVFFLFVGELMSPTIYEDFVYPYLQNPNFARFDFSTSTLTFFDWSKAAEIYNEWRITNKSNTNKSILSKQKEALKKALLHGNRAKVYKITNVVTSGKTEMIFIITSEDISKFLSITQVRIV